MTELTDEALSVHPAVRALVAEAVAAERERGMGRVASELRQMSMMVPDYESNQILENRARAIRTEAAAIRKGDTP